MIRPTGSSLPPVVVTGRFDATDEDSFLGVSTAKFLKSAEDAGQQAPDRFKASVVVRDRPEYDGKNFHLAEEHLRKSYNDAESLALSKRLTEIHELRNFRPYPRAHHVFDNGSHRTTEVAEDKTGFHELARELAKNLKSYPSGFHIASLMGHGANGQIVAGAPRGEVMEGLRQGVAEGGRKVDIVAVESCLSCHLDNLPALGDVGRIAIMSQSTLFSGSDALGSIPQQALASESPRDLATSIIEKSRSDVNIPTLTAIDLEKVQSGLLPALDRLGRQLIGESIRSGDHDLRNAATESQKTTEDHSGLDLGSFLENLSELELMDSTRQALEATVKAFKESRIGHHRRALDPDEPLVAGASHDHVSRLEGISFSVAPGEDTGLPEGWTGFLSTLFEKGAGSASPYTRRLESGLKKAIGDFEKGEPTVVAFTTPRSLRKAAKALELHEIPFQVNLGRPEDAGVSGGLTLWQHPGPTSDSYRPPEEQLGEVEHEPINYKQMAIDSGDAGDAGRPLSIHFYEPGQASRLGAWFELDIPQESTEMEYEGEGAPVVLDANNYRLSGDIHTFQLGTTASDDADLSQVDVSALLARRREIVEGQRPRSGGLEFTSR